MDTIMLLATAVLMASAFVWARNLTTLVVAVYGIALVGTGLRGLLFGEWGSFIGVVIVTGVLLAVLGGWLFWPVGCSGDRSI